MSGSQESNPHTAPTFGDFPEDWQFDIEFKNPPSEGYDVTFGGVEEEVSSGITGGVTLPFPLIAPKAEGIFSELSFLGQLTLGVLKPTPSLQGFYDIDTFTGFSVKAQQAFQAARPLKAAVKTQFYESLSEGSKLTSIFEEAMPLKEFKTQVFEEAYKVSSYAVSFYQSAQPIKTYNLGSFQEALIVSSTFRSGFETAKLIGGYARGSFQEAIRMSNRFGGAMQETEWLSERYSFASYYSSAVNTSFATFFQNAEVPVNVVKVVVPPVIPEPSQVHDFDLTFNCLPPELSLLPYHYDVIFNHGCNGGKPPSSTDYTEPYFVINSIELTNLETGEVIQSTGISFSTDLSSFAWSGSMTVTASEIIKLRSPTNSPVKVGLTFNGNPAVFMVQRISKAVSFNNITYKVDLVSPTMLLDSPYSRLDSKTVSTAASPQALIEPLLNTLVTGLTLNWQYVSPLDWVVAANTFSYQESSPIKAIGTLLEGSAAFMYSELDGTRLTIKRKRQVEFWEQGINPVVLTTDFLTSLSFEREQHRHFDAVYVVSGLNGSVGLTAHVLREEYAGTELAPQVVAPTLTSPTVARDAGKYVLGTAGIVETRTLSQPIIEGYPLVLPSDLVQFEMDDNTYIGTVLSTSVALKFNSQYQNFVVEVVKGFI